MMKYALLLAAGLALFSHGAGAEQTVRLMANTSPPYADQKLPSRGLAVELVEHVFARTDYHPEITIENWSRAVEGARLGVYDGLAAAWYSEDRDRDLLFSEPYLSSDLVILKLRTDTRRYGRLEDLVGARLGVRTDYAYGVDFGAIRDLQLVEENHLVQNLLNLLNGRVDVVIGDRRTVIYELNEYLADRLNSFAVTSIPLPARERHVAVSRSLAGSEQVVAAFNRALAETRKDGSLDAIVRRWDEKLGGLE